MERGCRCDDDFVFEFDLVRTLAHSPRVRDGELRVTVPMVLHYFYYSNCCGDFVEPVLVQELMQVLEVLDLILELVQRPTRLR
jgi:hypothetical protein